MKILIITGGNRISELLYQADTIESWITARKLDYYRRLKRAVNLNNKLHNSDTKEYLEFVLKDKEKIVQEIKEDQENLRKIYKLIQSRFENK